MQTTLPTTMLAGKQGKRTVIYRYGENAPLFVLTRIISAIAFLDQKHIIIYHGFAAMVWNLYAHKCIKKRTTRFRATDLIVSGEHVFFYTIETNKVAMWNTTTNSLAHFEERMLPIIDAQTLSDHRISTRHFRSIILWDLKSQTQVKKINIEQSYKCEKDYKIDTNDNIVFGCVGASLYAFDIDKDTIVYQFRFDHDLHNVKRIDNNTVLVYHLLEKNDWYASEVYYIDETRSYRVKGADMLIAVVRPIDIKEGKIAWVSGKDVYMWSIRGKEKLREI
jgi:hypothetical protein